MKNLCCFSVIFLVAGLSPSAFSGDFDPARQAGSFRAPLERRVHPVWVDGEFTSGQRKKIARAVEAWNAVSGSSLGVPFFRLEHGGLPAVPELRKPERKHAYPFDCRRWAVRHPLGGLWIQRIDSSRQWDDLKLTEGAGAASYRCPGRKGIRHLVILVNTLAVNYDIFLPVMLHELGHSIGLGHSCSFSKVPGMPWCRKLKRSHPFRKAIMYPGIEAAAGYRETHRGIGENDIQRMEFLYGGWKAAR